MPEELKKLNNYKTLIVIGYIVFLLLCIFFYIKYFSSCDRFCHQISLFCAIIIIILPIFLFTYFLSKAEGIFIPYVTSAFPDWKMIIKRGNKVKTNKSWPQEALPSKEFVYSEILPANCNEMLYVTDAFQTSDNKQTITQIMHVDTDTKESFYATLIVVKMPENLNSITCFKTTNYPKGIRKKVCLEKSKLDLPKIELPAAAQFDICGNNPSIAEKLAKQEFLSSVLNLKERLGLTYVKVLFHDDIIVFVLRQKDFDILNYRTFFIKIPVLKNIDKQLLDQAVNNFRLLTEVANKAADFTKNL